MYSFPKKVLLHSRRVYVCVFVRRKKAKATEEL